MVKTITEICEQTGLSRQAVFTAIKSGRVKAKKVKNAWLIEEKDWDKYEESRWERTKHYKNGEISVKMAAKILNVPIMHMYYLVWRGLVPSEKRGGMIYLRRENI